MGNPIRCPKCNRFGNKDIEGNFCRSCFEKLVDPDQKLFLRKINQQLKRVPKIVASALLEVGCTDPKDVKATDRPIVLRIIQKRFRNKRDGHIVRGNSQFEDYRSLYRSTGDEYKIIKGVAGIEH